MMRSDTPYADLYERCQELSALAQAAAYWALDILKNPDSDDDSVEGATRVLRLAMNTRRTLRAQRAKILDESFRKEFHGGY
jgi:hypothetical protein